MSRGMVPAHHDTPPRAEQGVGPLGYVFATLSPIPARCQRATKYPGNRSPLKGRWRALMISKA